MWWEVVLGDQWGKHKRRQWWGKLYLYTFTVRSGDGCQCVKLCRLEDPACLGRWREGAPAVGSTWKQSASPALESFLAAGALLSQELGTNPLYSCFPAHRKESQLLPSKGTKLATFPYLNLGRKGKAGRKALTKDSLLQCWLWSHYLFHRWNAGKIFDFMVILNFFFRLEWICQYTKVKLF